jgi:ribosomal protein S18 acetylase RimI-like enzyme
MVHEQKDYVPIRVKPCEPHHLPALRELYLISRTTTFTWLKTQDFRLGDFDTDTLGETIWVVEIAEKVRGFISIWEPDQFVHHLYVDQSFQHQGIGTLLIKKALETYDRLSLKCMVQNQRAKDFYEFLGFTTQSQVDDEFGGYYLMVKKVLSI